VIPRNLSLLTLRAISAPQPSLRIRTRGSMPFALNNAHRGALVEFEPSSWRPSGAELFVASTFKVDV